MLPTSSLALSLALQTGGVTIFEDSLATQSVSGTHFQAMRREVPILFPDRNSPRTTAEPKAKDAQVDLRVKPRAGVEPPFPREPEASHGGLPSRTHHTAYLATTSQQRHTSQHCSPIPRTTTLPPSR